MQVRHLQCEPQRIRPSVVSRVLAALAWLHQDEVVTDHSHPAAVIQRLADIEHDLAERMGDYEDAATAKARLVRDWEKRLAAARLNAKGSDAEGRKAAALMTAIEADDLYERLKAAEGAYEGCRAVVKVLEVRATVGMSILRAHGRS